MKILFLKFETEADMLSVLSQLVQDDDRTAKEIFSADAVSIYLPNQEGRDHQVDIAVCQIGGFGVLLRDTGQLNETGKMITEPVPGFHVNVRVDDAIVSLLPSALIAAEITQPVTPSLVFV